MRNIHWRNLLFASAVLMVAACSQTSAADTPYEKPATVDTVPGSSVKMLKLTDKAVERLGVETVAISDGPDGTVIPYASVIYLPDGTTWAYTSPSKNTFVRAELTVKEVIGDQAILTDGPPVGTMVATVGVAELFGTENKVGK